MTMTTGKKIRASALAFVGAGAAACLCMPAAYGRADARAAPRADEIASEQVNIADLDLSRTSGQRELKARIQGAATRVCRFDGFLDTACVDVATVDGLNQAYSLGQVDPVLGAAAASAVLTIRGRHD